MRISKLSRIRESAVGELDVILYARLYHTHQQERIRRRLRFIKRCLTTELSCKEICLEFAIYDQFYDWLYMHEKDGLIGLCKRATRVISNRITESQKLELKEILLTKTPDDFGYDRNLWTAQTIIQLLLDKWNISYKDSRIYEILDGLGL